MVFLLFSSFFFLVLKAHFSWYNLFHSAILKFEKSLPRLTFCFIPSYRVLYRLTIHNCHKWREESVPHVLGATTRAFSGFVNRSHLNWTLYTPRMIVRERICRARPFLTILPGVYGVSLFFFFFFSGAKSPFLVVQLISLCNSQTWKIFAQIDFWFYSLVSGFVST